MVDRINLLLQAKNITSRQFAEEIGIQPSGMSHILSGRNNPSLDFVMKVIRRWPEININWLMFGKGEMFTSVMGGSPVRSASPAVQVAEAPKPAASEPDLFTPVEPAAAAVPAPAPAPVPEPAPDPVPAQVTIPVAEQPPVVAPEPTPAPAPAPAPEQAPAAVAGSHIDENRVKIAAPTPAQLQPILANHKKIVKMVVLYDDHTFAEYYPE